MTTALKPMSVAPPTSRTVVFSLARFEAHRALRHPLTWIGALGSLWLMSQSRWPEVIDPVTTSADLAEWFGMSAPVYPETDFYQEPCR